MLKKLLLLPFLGLFFFAQAQENTPMRVIHCSAVDQQSSIQNIFVNKQNDKFVAASGELYQLFSADNSSQIQIEETQWALLLENDGNHDIKSDKSQLNAILRPTPVAEKEVAPLPKINVAYFDDKEKNIWIGTAGNGLFQLQNINGGLKLIQHFTADNSKLKTDQINTILKDKYNRLWVGTDQGVLMRKGDDDWKLYEKRDKILAITALGPDVWILGEDILWMVDDRNRWIPGDVDRKLYQGDVRDIQYDSEGRLWVASEVITRYDVVEDKVEIFNRSNGFTSKDVSCIRVDQEDALWVGTLDKGLFLIEPAAKMTVSCVVEKGISCEGGAQQGELRVKIFGGQEPYAYRWTNDLEGEHPTNLGPGIYTVTVTDAAGQTRSASAKIEGAKLIVEANAQKEESTFDSKDGIAQVKANGGTPGYSYLWDNGEKSPTATQLDKGTHAVTVTDRLGCNSVVTVKIGRVPPPEPEKIPALELSLKSEGKILCPQDETVELNAVVSGGKAPYKYAWNQQKLKGAKTKKLGVGNYQLTVTDALGTKAETSITLTAPSPMNVRIKEIEAATKEGSRDGIASLAIDGGTGPFVVLWDNGEVNKKASKLSPGKHTVQISDANGCETKGSIRINKKIIPALSARNLRTGQKIRIEQLFFQADSTNLTNVSEPVLVEMYEFLEKNSGITVEIGGHTNDIPAHEYCDRLSTQRAKSVVDYLILKGIPASRLTYKGYGKRSPLVSNRTAQGRKKNQRVEIKILKMGG